MKSLRQVSSFWAMTVQYLTQPEPNPWLELLITAVHFYNEDISLSAVNWRVSSQFSGITEGQISNRAKKKKKRKEKRLERLIWTEHNMHSQLMYEITEWSQHSQSQVSYWHPGQVPALPASNGRLPYSEWNSKVWTLEFYSTLSLVSVFWVKGTEYVNLEIASRKPSSHKRSRWSKK